MISTQADEMNTEVMENAANAATKRREARRRRILQDPEERMRKLTGYNNSGQEPSHAPYSSNPRQINGVEADPTLFSRTPPIDDMGSHLFREPYAKTASNPQHGDFGSDPPFADLFRTNTPTAFTAAGTQSPHTLSTAEEKPPPSQRFTNVRRLVCLLLGVIVRVSLIYSIGRRFIQSIINPFVFFEVAVLGYQRAVGMDLGSTVKGGLWLSTLVLSGIKPEVIDSYKTVMGVVTAVLDDFSLYFFAFVAVHLVCLLFA